MSGFERGGGQGLKASKGTLKLCFFFKKKTGRCFESGMTHFITGCWMTSKFAPIVGAGLRTDEVSLLHDMYSTSENPGDFLWSAGVYVLSCRRTSFESLFQVFFSPPNAGKKGIFVEKYPVLVTGRLN